MCTAVAAPPQCRREVVNPPLQRGIHPPEVKGRSTFTLRSRGCHEYVLALRGDCYEDMFGLAPHLALDRTVRNTTTTLGALLLFLSTKMNHNNVLVLLMIYSLGGTDRLAR